MVNSSIYNGKALILLATETNPSATDALPVGFQVRDLRKAKGLTIQWLADRVGRSIGYISQIERNKSAVTIPVLNEIALALGVNISWFFREENNPTKRMHIIVI